MQPMRYNNTSSPIYRLVQGECSKIFPTTYRTQERPDRNIVGIIVTPKSKADSVTWPDFRSRPLPWRWLRQRHRFWPTRAIQNVQNKLKNASSQHNSPPTSSRKIEPYQLLSARESNVRNRFEIIFMGSDYNAKPWNIEFDPPLGSPQNVLQTVDASSSAQAKRRYSMLLSGCQGDSAYI